MHKTALFICALGLAATLSAHLTPPKAAPKYQPNTTRSTLLTAAPAGIAVPETAPPDAPVVEAPPAPLVMPKTLAEWNPPIEINPTYSYHATTELPTIDEGRIRRVIYVDQNHPEADDANPGTAEAPLLTIKAAAPLAVASLMDGVATKVHIGPGLYREKVTYNFNLPKGAADAQRQTLFIIEGVPGKTVISGAIEHEGEIDFRPETWESVEGEDFLYVHDWPYTIAPEPGPWINNYGFALLPGTVQRPEMIWLDGVHQRQIEAERYRWEDPDGVATMLDPGPGRVDKSENNQPGQLVFDRLSVSDPAELTDPGSFVLYSAPESPDSLRGKIFLKLDHNINEVQSIEVGRWVKGWSPILAMGNRENFVVRGIDFTQNMANFFCPALVVSDASNFIVEDCTFNNNAGRGFSVERSSRGIIRRCEANDNAGNGMSAGGSQQLLFEDFATHFNNWRGAWNAFIGWDAAGFKSGGVDNITIRRHAAIGNYATGMWYDVYCTNILIEDSFYLGNKRMGVMLEFTRPKGGPQILRNSIAAFNNTGVFVSMAANTTVDNNLILGNKEGHVEDAVLRTQLLYKFHKRKGGPQNAQDWESVRVTRNVVAAREGSIADYIDRKSDPLTQFPFILEVLHSGDNQYWLPSQETTFRSNDGSWLDFAGWKTLLAEFDAPGPHDANSRWSPVPWEDDEQLEFTEAATSPVSDLARQMGVPLPESVIQEYWKRLNNGLYEAPHIIYTRLYD